MFGNLWKDGGQDKVGNGQKAEGSPAEQELQNPAAPPVESENEKGSHEVGGSLSDPAATPADQCPSVSHEEQTPQDRDENGEGQVLQDILGALREYGQTHDGGADDDFPGLEVEVSPFSEDEADGGVELGPDGPEEESVEPAASTTDGDPLRKRRGLLSGPRTKGRRLAKPDDSGKIIFTPQQRLLLLDTWNRSGLNAGDFASLVGISKYTLYKWKRRFGESGPEGLMDQPPRQQGKQKLSELTRRAILMMKQANPDWGCQRISDMLRRGPALPASASTVGRVLKESGYQLAEEPSRPHPQKARRFERAKPNQLWQTDLFTFTLKRQNRRLYLIAFMDDHSRFIVSFGLSASATTAQVIEILEAGIASYGVPEEVLTDNGPQYVTWRGKSRFTKQLEKRGIRQIVARPKRPQTLGKIERFWGTMWRDFLEAAIFTDLEDARRRISHFIDYYNFARVHQGIDGLVPADRFFSAAPEVLRTLKERVAANALQLARHGESKKPFYVTGQVDGQSFSVHSEGDRLILRRDGEDREEVELTSPPATDEERPDAKPLCADGSLPSQPGEPADQPPPLPGESVIPLESTDEPQGPDGDSSEPSDEQGGEA
jgi:transposase InsO family protein